MGINSLGRGLSFVETVSSFRPSMLPPVDAAPPARANNRVVSLFVATLSLIGEGVINANDGATSSVTRNSLEKRIQRYNAMHAPKYPTREYSIADLRR
mmetsp:Transcript_35298/g.39050  ORF Transcript_35298/g.39050 Transcript_35298/m.39050 type:complete len:98 (-) Transcript_35298:36-329(-)